MKFAIPMIITFILFSCKEELHFHLSNKTGNAAVVSFKNIADLSLGPRGSCLLQDGNVYCWGLNNSGALGVGGFAPSYFPQKVQGIPEGKVTKLATVAMNDHQCAIAGDEVYCWGVNRNGSLGTQEAAIFNSPVPLKVQGIEGLQPTLVAAGKYNTCIAFDGIVKCAGWNYANALGRGPVVGNLNIFTDVAGLPGDSVIDIKKGEHSTCVLLINSSVWCWGDGVRGGLGIGTTAHQHTAREVFPDGVTKLTYNGATGCVVRDEKVFCWGMSTTNQIPGNALTNVNPIEITGFPDDVIDIAAASSTICGVTKKFETYCWGGTDLYLLGREEIGDNTIPMRNPHIPPIDNIQQFKWLNSGFCTKKEDQYFCWGSNYYWNFQRGLTPPTLLPGFSNVQNLSGNNSAETTGTFCVTSSSNEAHCWGRGYLNGTSTITSVANPIKMNFPSGIEKIVVGGDASHYCALLENGNVSCLGAGGNGRLGNGLTVFQESPQVTYSGEDATDISCSAASCCMVHNGTISCWGSETNGILANGEATERLVPTPISSARNDFVDIKLHTNNNACARTNGGEVYCWGATAVGQDPNDICSGAFCSTPQAVSLPLSITKIEVGNRYACALNISKELWCWGSNSKGQLGQDHFDISYAPVKVRVPWPIEDFWITSETTYLKAGGGIYCLGSSEKFNCGPQLDQNLSLPLKTSLPVNIKSISQSFLATCALLESGRVSCWGHHGHGNSLGPISVNSGSFIPIKIEF